MSQLDVLEKIIATARKELGVAELPGGAHNPRILEYFKRTSYKAATDEEAWCSAFVSWVLEECGLSSTKSAWARSYLTWGARIINPVEGCIVVLSRGADRAQGHVGFYVGEDESNIFVLGGNQGNAVKIAAYPKTRFLDYRRPLV